MKVLATILLVIGVANYAQGLDCLFCTVASTAYNGHPTEICMHPVTTGSTTTPTKTCPTAATDTVQYCRSKFVIKDGVVTEAERDCVSSGTDHDIHTAAVPGGDRCTTVFDASGNPTGETSCYFSCSTDNCNTVSAVNVQKCSSDCNSGSQGECNYITGTCDCESGFTGTDCGTAVTATTPTPTASRECVQCNSETDSACASSTTSVACAGSEAYCSTAVSTIYDSSYAAVKNVTVRGCTTARQVVDQCFFSQIFTDATITAQGYNEVTCMSTCDSNGCNTNTANGVVDGSEIKRLHCVQCTQAATDAHTAGCAIQTSRSICPSGSTYCKSTVTYLMSEKTDLFHTDDSPAFKLRSVVRECATASVTAACNSTTIGTVTGAKIYECTETCQGDGCNVGWPNRPNCIDCDSPSTPATEFDGCIDNPPEAAACTYPYQKYCVIMDRGIESNFRERITGYPRRISRKCSHVDIGTSCTSSTIRSTGVDDCNRTCTTDGCNVGSGSSMPIISLMALLIPTVLGWFAQAHL